MPEIMIIIIAKNCCHYLYNYILQFESEKYLPVEGIFRRVRKASCIQYDKNIGPQVQVHVISITCTKKNNNQIAQKET